MIAQLHCTFYKEVVYSVSLNSTLRKIAAKKVRMNYLVHLLDLLNMLNPKGS